MPRLVAVLSGLLCATNALRPQTRHQFLQNVIKGAALLPAAATASTRDYTPADQDMKGLLVTDRGLAEHMHTLAALVDVELPKNKFIPKKDSSFQGPRVKT